MARKPLSSFHPILYKSSVGLRRALRASQWKLGKQSFALERQQEDLPYRVKKHQSKLLKKLGETDMQWQRNKVENLKIVAPLIDGLLIKPGQTFSFFKTIGKPTAERGFLEGMELSFGKPRAGIGGGICQSTNLLHWLAIHSNLTITERHHHTVDPFPDDGRVLPWASGAAVFYNYLDFQLRNDTNFIFQIRLRITEKLLEGEIRVNQELQEAYHIEERNHHFTREGNITYRSNEIWQKKIAKFQGGKLLDEKLLYKNKGRVLYA
jgi:vancomycin resistance protein VanW